VLVLLLGNVCWRFYRVTFGEAWEIVMCIMDIFLLGNFLNIFSCSNSAFLFLFLWEKLETRHGG
jgi:hypothetical protein